MLKQIIIGFAFMISVAAFSQVGIGTVNPHASADLELGTNNKALYLNRVANTAAVANPQPGMMIYDLSGHCVKVFEGNPAKWSDCLIGGDGAATAFTCGSAAFSPATATQGTPYTGTLTVPYTGGNGGAYAAQTLSQNGLTFTLPAGSFAMGAGSLVYNITGTPATGGSTSVNVTAGGQSCNGLTLTVNPNGTGVVTGDIVLVQNRMYWIASVYDTDYIPYTVPTGAASIAVVNANNSPDAFTANYQGSLSTAGIAVRIPVASVTGSGNIAAWTNTFVVPAAYAEDGQSRTLELSWAAQPYDSSTKYINGTIKSLGGDFLAKKLDINAGLGSDYLGFLLGTFKYPYNNAGTLTNYELRDTPGIPDRMIGVADNASNINSHLMLYLPVQGEDGKIWLNNNLGAHYSNITHVNFNPGQQAATATDHLAYGSLFQFGRKGDGHDLMTRTGPGNAQTTAVHGTIAGPRTEPLSTPNYITGSGDWKNPANDGTRWAGVSAPNNPCPYKFRVPTDGEQTALATILNAMPAPANVVEKSALRLSLAGYRNGGANTSMGASGFYFSSSPIGNSAYSVLVNSGGTLFNASSGLTNGQSVRCIQD